MLKTLIIKNFIIADDVEINFSEKLQVLTGETGAGKSIVVGALNLILGDQIRSGLFNDENRAVYLEAVFNPDNLPELKELIEEYDIDMVDNELFFVKEISPAGKVKTFINGIRVTNTAIKKFSDVLLDFHSQRDQQLLLNSTYQRELLDKAGNLENDLTVYQTLFDKISADTEQLHKLKTEEREQNEKIQLYRYQMQELADANLRQSEDEELNNELNLLSHAEEILKNCAEFEQIVYENETSVYDQVSHYLKVLSAFTEDNENIGKSVNHLEEALSHIDEANSCLRNVKNIIDLDKERLEEVSARVDYLNSIKSKYRMNMQELIVYTERINQAITQFTSGIKEIENLEKTISLNKQAIFEKAQEISRKRRITGEKLSKQLETNIRLLSMEGAKFEIKINELKNGSIVINDHQLSRSGIDNIEFYFSANPGKETQPVRIAASGGELSRLLLAIKKALSDKLTPRTIVFDEIDAGIGGKTAELIGEFISDIANNHQILCITHLPQIASFASDHFKIVKKTTSEKTELDVQRLTIDERKVEIARMLSGSDSELAIKHAEELLTKKIIGNNDKENGC